MPAKFELIAPCFFGCESTAKFELTRIGAENIRVDDGRLSFAGGAEMIAAANLNLRTVERVMLLLARYRAATFDDLFDGVYGIPWEELLPADAAFPVTGSSLNSQLSSVPACQSIIKKAVVKRLMAKHHTSVLPETGAEYKIRFMLRKDQCEIMLDTTGDGLHKRGYRRNAMEAPIRETLAATIADLGRVRRDSLVEDPFCGSGTLRIAGAGIGVGGDNLPYLPGLILDDVSFSSGAIFLNERSYSGAPALFVRSGSLETDTLVLSGDLCIAGGSGTVQYLDGVENAVFRDGSFEVNQWGDTVIPQLILSGGDATCTDWLPQGTSIEVGAGTMTANGIRYWDTVHVYGGGKIVDLMDET